MAIEITKLGRLPEEKKYSGTCGNCKTKFTCLQKDGKYTFDQRDGEFVRVDCPLCGHPAYAYPAEEAPYKSQDNWN